MYEAMCADFGALLRQNSSSAAQSGHLFRPSYLEYLKPLNYSHSDLYLSFMKVKESGLIRSGEVYNPALYK